MTHHPAALHPPRLHHPQHPDQGLDRPPPRRSRLRPRRHQFRGRQGRAHDLPALWHLDATGTWAFTTTTPAESHGYIGERLDADAGLQYLNARYYDPKLCMFIQPDWFEGTQAGGDEQSIWLSCA